MSRRSDGVQLHRPGRTYNINRILSATVDDVAVDPAELVIDDWQIYRTEGLWSCRSATRPLNIVLEYTYGQTFPDPEARERGIELLAANITPGDMPSRATSFNNEDGTFRISTWPVSVEEFIKARDVRVALS
jgi:hypothetical protein